MSLETVRTPQSDTPSAADRTSSPTSSSMDAGSQTDPLEPASTTPGVQDKCVVSTEQVSRPTDLTPPCKSFNNLPNDIWRIIFEHIKYKPHLAAACLTSKRFQGLATPNLYRTIKIDIGIKDDHTLVDLFDPANPGLAHVRELVVFYPECAEWAQAQLTLSMIIKNLQVDQLENFHWYSWSPLSTRNVQMLCKRQRKLKDMEVLFLDGALSEANLPFDNLISDNLEKLSIYLNSKDAMDYAHELLKRIYKPLKHLRFDTNLTKDDNDDQDPIQDTVNHAGRVYRTLWKHRVGDSTANKLQVQKLNFHKIALNRAESWLHHFDLSRLRRLKLTDCEGAPEALSAICRYPPSSLNLKRFTIEHCEKSSAGDARGAIDTFLSVVSGLEYISIDLCCSEHMVRTQPICRHAETLKYLNVFITKDREENRYLYWEPSALKEIATKCTVLSQLSIAGTNADILEGNAEGENAAIEEALMGEESNLQNLKTLQFTTWPDTRKIKSSKGPKLSRTLYDAMLQASALRLFTAKDNVLPKLPRLSAVAWGAYKSKNTNCFSIFVRGTQATMLGPQMTAAIPVSWEWVQHNHFGPKQILSSRHIKKFTPTDVAVREAERDNMPLHVKPWD